MKQLPILIVEDDASLREALVDTLELSRYRVLIAQDGVQALAVLRQHAVGLVITDVQMPNMTGLQLLHEIKSEWPHVPVLLMTAYGVISQAVEAMREGACDYLVKPFEVEDLLSRAARWMLPASFASQQQTVMDDPASSSLYGMALKVADTPATVMITGESGTGKEVMARFIHQHSSRAEKPFVAVNCAAIPDNLLEATMFGYEKGAFTGATQAQPGKFEQAQGGTLLLDEISEMPLALQAKLLRVLQEREVERVGGHKAIALDVRVLATSNRDMKAEVEKGAFREDLFYRLNVFPLQIAPLRERVQDILPLARHFLSEMSASMGRKSMRLSDEAEQTLLSYPWPGNARELENVIQRAVILAGSDNILPQHLHLPISAQRPHRQPPDVTGEASGEINDLKSLEKVHIMNALDSVNGSRKLAAQKLGMSERTLRHKLQQYREGK
ncbi:two-component system, response regulator FlrC [Novimethylophilus kurashikiensis]|uniref:Two-component system, response regulator FlrC n=1 Tax=Novimethylophilus kurashikiensis TaxID=1825523 RepID=A0A2R5F2R7_9PROT|nr:sigma-54 dependent transcriptional regulator [Novimethylophilus kurashikiensis]GBG12867.1 two-component system, response regulator FlrC [Novimethylophilus kurashikiensis]